MASLDGKRWSLIGVVSWGKRCGLAGVNFVGYENYHSVFVFSGMACIQE